MAVNSTPAADIPVAVIGDAVADVVALGLAALPDWGEDQRVERLDLLLGGAGLHTSVNLATLGLPTTLHAAIGDDRFGRFLLEELAPTPVSVRGVRVLQGAPTAVTLVLSGASDRAFVSLYGATAAFRRADLDEADLRRARHIHISGFWQSDALRPELADLLRELRANGATVSLDTGYDATGEWSDFIDPVLDEVDVFFPNEVEATSIARVESVEEALTVLAARVPLVVVKLGPLGAMARRGDETWSRPAFDVPVVDTTGAGDAFNAGFLRRWLVGASIPEALELGTALGAMAVMRPGASEGAPDLAAAERFIATHTAGAA